MRRPLVVSGKVGGKAADLVVLDRNLRSIPAVEINGVRVLHTLVDGSQVYPPPVAAR